MKTSVLDWLDNTAEKYAGKTVFADENRKITFSEFNNYTKSIGTYLARLVSGNAPVVVMSGRHVLTPATFLGVVRAGCFYAPMDATMPLSRLNSILGVIKSDFMLVDKEHLETAKNLTLAEK